MITLKNLKVREQGEPNNFAIDTEDDKNWVAVVLFNGELTLTKQREMIEKIIKAIEEQ